MYVEGRSLYRSDIKWKKFEPQTNPDGNNIQGEIVLCILIGKFPTCKLASNNCYC